MAVKVHLPPAGSGPGPVVDFNSYDERKRLSGSSLTLFFKLMEIWKVGDEDAKLLLGGVSDGPFYRMKKNPSAMVLGVDQMYRVSYLFGIFEAVNMVHGDELADRWIQMPNQNQLFQGKTPLQYMIEGGLPALRDVRRLLEARTQGI